MTNQEVFKKTVSFSVRRLLLGALTVVLFIVLCAGGYLIMEKINSMGLLGLGIGFAVAVIISIIIAHFFTYALHAAQVAMITKGVTEGALPENVYEEGIQTVKQRFTTVAAYYAATNLISGIFRQIGNLITKIGGKIGGDAGETIGNVISAAVQILIGFLSDCCLGWVFYRRDQSAMRSTCEGAVIFFKNGKTLLKNIGRIFGMGIVSFVAVAGVFTGICYPICLQFKGAFAALAEEITRAAANSADKFPEFFKDPNHLALCAAFLIGCFIWGIVNSAFVRPLILTGVLRNFMEAGISSEPKESDYTALCGKSKKFADAYRKLGGTA